MRIISLKLLKKFWAHYPDAKDPLRLWYKTAKRAEWRNFLDIRGTFGAADIVKVASGHNVVIFDIGGNKYRLITSIHYNTGMVYALLVLTHKEYDKDRWKDIL
jgi:mRNA interferase HigB